MCVSIYTAEKPEDTEHKAASDGSTEVTLYFALCLYRMYEFFKKYMGPAGVAQWLSIVYL